MTTELKQNIAQLKKWYAKFSFPAYGTKAFFNACASVQGISNSIRRNFASGGIPIRFDSGVSTALFDGTTIKIDSSYLVPETYSNLKINDSELPFLMIGVVTGLAIHETGHSVFSMGLFLNKSGASSVRPAYQIVEDWYLERKLRASFPEYEPMMDVVSEFFFPESAGNHPQGFSGDLAKLAIYLKNPGFVRTFLSKAGPNFENFPELVSKKVSRILDLYYETADHSADDLAVRLGIGKRLEELLTNDGDKSILSRMSLDTRSESTSPFSSGSSVYRRIETASTTQDIMKLASSISSQINEVLGIPQENVIIKNPKDSFQTESMYRKLDLVEDERFTTFAESLRKTATIVGTAKMRSTFGRFNSKASHRVYVDGKTFNPRLSEDSGKRMVGHDFPYVGIMIDTSGSTAAADGKHPLFYYFMSIGYSISDSLRRAESPFHTVIHNYRTEAVFVPVNKPFKPISGPQLKEAFDAYMRVGPYGSNADWLIMNQLSILFPKVASKKVILVISDGAPTAGSNDPEKSLSEGVAQLRRRGFIIGAIAVGKEAYSRSKEIYGRKWTFDATGKIATSKEVSQFAMSLITEM